ncbi:MAG: hypothetical protein AB1631_06895 [Acidobacteriota bacterium]
MSNKPHFELSRVFDDGSQDEAEIIPVTSLPWDTRMDRRGFLGAGLSAAAVMFLCLAIADDRLLISGSADETINLWSIADRKLIDTLKGHKSAVTSVAPTPDGKTLVSGDSDGIIILWNFEERGFRTFLFDRAANDPDTKAISYTVYDRVTGRRITYTLPCGSKIPPGSVCVCNCVRGSYREPEVTDSFRICTCNKICTCIPVYRR